MPRSIPALPMILLAAALAGCGAARERAVATTPPPASAAVERPVPHRVEPSPGFAAAIAAGTRTPSGEPGPAYWQQRADYAIDVRVDPTDKRVDGSVAIDYANASPDTLRGLVLQLVQNHHAPGVERNEPAEVTGGVAIRGLAVDGVEIAEGVPAGEDPGPLWFRTSATTIGIIPPAPVPPGGSAAIEVDYGFRIPRQGASGRMGWSGDDLVYLAYFYPKMAVYDDIAGWDFDPFLGNAEFYADFGRYEVALDAPAGWLVEGTGILVNPEATLAEPVRERLAQAAAGDEVVRVVAAEGAGPVTLPGRDGRLVWRFVADAVNDVAYTLNRRSNWDVTRTAVGDRDGDGATDYARIGAIWRPSAPKWSEVARYAAHAITAHGRFTGLAYPWPHMTAVEGGGIIGGGMEFPMMTIMGDYNAQPDTNLYAVTAHELAHMWVPMIVANDERTYGWMDEGTTTFNENVAKFDFYPGVDWHGPDRETYLELARAGGEGEIMRPSDFHATGAAYGVASYQKPASLLVALQALLGEDVFREAYRAFFDRWAFRHPYPWDLWNTFEDLAGRDLDWFWRSWYHETWTLDQGIEAVTTVGDATTIAIVDEGEAPMPVRLAIERADGTVERHEIPVDAWLRGSRRATLAVAAEPAVVRVEIDPEGAFPDLDPADDVWPR